MNSIKPYNIIVVLNTHNVKTYLHNLMFYKYVLKHTKLKKVCLVLSSVEYYIYIHTYTCTCVQFSNTIVNIYIIESFF